MMYSNDPTKSRTQRQLVLPEVVHNPNGAPVRRGLLRRLRDDRIRLGARRGHRSGAAAVYLHRRRAHRAACCTARRRPICATPAGRYRRR